MKMHLTFRRISLLLFTAFLPALCAANIIAQNAPAEPFSSVGSLREALEFIPEAETRSDPKSIRIGQTIATRNSAQIIEKNEESDEAAANNVEDFRPSNSFRQPVSGSFKYNFPGIGKLKSPIIFALTTTAGSERFPPDKPSAALFTAFKDTLSPDAPAPPRREGFNWRGAIGQSLIFLAVQHGYAVTQPKTREALKGKFWKDYTGSVRALRGWDDGGRFFTNYIAHPLQGSFTGFIYVQNSPQALREQFSMSGKYWRTRLKAMAWSAAWSTQFEIGPISQASIGNVGLKGKQTWGDVVVTPTVGTAMLISEDAIDRFIMKRIERSTGNYYVVIFSRMLLNPTRTVANLFRFKLPWYRDRPREY